MTWKVLSLIVMLVCDIYSKYSISISLFGNKYKQTSNHAPQKNKQQKKNEHFLFPGHLK